MRVRGDVSGKNGFEGDRGGEFGGEGADKPGKRAQRESREAQALRGVSFDVEHGQTVALVGRSGAGKTTCANLVMRFWDPGEGHVRLSGHDLR
ncbi:MAG: ATP-binding cassette domain-containing protein, partial [Proteobacteria bacterium]|nr:ATP-binding cassette domain-containing protein [Pseudomonadota bacterium]